MLRHLLTTCLSFIFLYHNAVAQTQPTCPSNDTPSVDFCQDACVYCYLTGFTGTTTGFSGQEPPGGFCGTIENEQWVAFIAVDTIAELTATPYNCQNGNGVQIALYPDCFSAPVGCDGGNQGGGNTAVSISVHLVPGQTYFLMIDGYAGDVCDFTLAMNPPSAGASNVSVQDIQLCPGSTYTIDGVAYTAPNSIPVILAQQGDCDSVIVYNLIPVPTITYEQTFILCQDEGVNLNGQIYYAPDTVVFTTPGISGCDSIQTYTLQLKTFNYFSKDVYFCPGESVVINGVTYSQAGIVQDTVPGTSACDTIRTYTLKYFLEPGECPSCSPTFLHTLGLNGLDVRGHGIYNAPGGYLYVTGSKQDSSFLLKITPGGNILWMRTFDFLPGRDEHIAEILTDTSGMIAGCGRSDGAPADYKGFIFRYDPVGNTMLWARRLNSEVPNVSGILELVPGGNYTVYYQQTGPVVNAGILELNPIIGNFNFGSLSQKFDNGGEDNFASMVSADFQFYASGTYKGAGPAIHSALTRLNYQGNLDYALTYHVPDNSTAVLAGRDLLAEGDFVYSLSSGNENGNDLNDSKIFLQRNDRASGGLSWMKRIDLENTGSEIADEIVSVPDGFVLYCRSLYQDANVFYLVKTDKSGNLVWSKQLSYGTYEAMLGTTSIQSQLLVKGDYLYAVATISDASGHDRLLLLKTRGDGSLETDCEYLSETPVTITEVVTPKQYSVTPAKIPANILPLPQQAPPGVAALTTEHACQVFLYKETDIAFCAGQSVLLNGMSYNQPGTVVDTLYGPGCDTIAMYHLTTVSQFTQTDTLAFCPGQSVVINGLTYNQSGSVVDSIPSASGCDTILTHILVLLPQPVRAETIPFCPGESVTIEGIVYNQSGTVVDTIPGISGCDTIVTYTLIGLPNPVRAETLTFCPGEPVTIGGIVYNQSGTVVDTIPGISGCDTIVTYTLIGLPQPQRAETIAFCPGEPVTIGGIVYNQSGTVVDTIPGISGCDTIVTYTLILLPQPQRAETLTFCPGESLIIGGVAYNQSGTVVDAIPAISGCDTIVTYTLIGLPNPTRAETLPLCSGESVTIGGIEYSQPGTVLDTILAASGCDTIVSYTLIYQTSPNSAVSISCPNAINIATDPNAGPVTVDYNLPVVLSDCNCPGIALTRTSGFASGSIFPNGTTAVCYSAKDSCGNTASCCFNVAISETETEACDIKVIGCMKYELLSITKNAGSDFTYRIRVTNSCTNKMIYSTIQLPDGVTALEPAQNAVYTAPGGRQYDVRNPNYSPNYSIRFKSKTDSIANGESDVFEYILPGQAPPSYIHVTSRLVTQVYYEAHLNTFYCPVGVTPANRSQQSVSGNPKTMRLYPNPTTGALYVDLSGWRDEPLQVKVLDGRGSLVQVLRLQAGEVPVPVQLAEELANGLYFLEMSTEGGERLMERFVLQR